MADFHPGIVTKTWSLQRGDTVVQLPQRTPFDTTVNRHSQSPADSLVDSAQDRLTDRDQLSQLLDTSRTDISDNSLDILLSELPIKMEPVQLINQLLTQLTTKPSTEIYPTPFTGTTANNISDGIENFDHIAAQSVWNDRKQLQIVPVYLKDTALNFYCSLPEQTKADINLLKDALRDHYHPQDRLYDMCVKLHE